jgi:hypothetical protein
MGSSAFQSHHIIPQEFSESPVVELLNESNLFDIDGANNLLFLPSSQALAEQLGIGLPQGSISPHNGGPLSSYQDPIENFLAQLAESPQFTAKFRGHNT